jgi:hypothetical protein
MVETGWLRGKSAAPSPQPQAAFHEVDAGSRAENAFIQIIRPLSNGKSGFHFS